MASSSRCMTTVRMVAPFAVREQVWFVLTCIRTRLGSQKWKPLGCIGEIKQSKHNDLDIVSQVPLESHAHPVVCGSLPSPRAVERTLNGPSRPRHPPHFMHSESPSLRELGGAAHLVLPDESPSLHDRARVTSQLDGATAAGSYSKDARLRGKKPSRFVRVPRPIEESDRLASSCEMPTARLVVRILPDSGLRCYRNPL
jgi:hypothetical protein